MHPLDRVSNSLKRGRRGLYENQQLLRLLRVSVPGVNRFHLGNDADARGQLFLYESISDSPGFFFRTCGRHNQSLVSHCDCVSLRQN
jgi:hypothetical protein